MSISSVAIDDLTIDHVRDLRGWPETQTLEFKRQLSDASGPPDSWAANGKLTEPARDKLFKEIVALANAQGGDVIVGLDEDSAGVATDLVPIPRCRDLAERLQRAATAVIDPPIPRLRIRGIEDEGDSGVVVLRVPASRMAPHRAPDRHCYVRRGTNSEPMRMREIQDLTLGVARGGAATEAAFRRMEADYQAWSREVPVDEWGYTMGLAAVPASMGLYAPSLREHLDPTRIPRKWDLSVGGYPKEALLIPFPEKVRRIVRGVRLQRFASDDADIRAMGLQLDAFQDGRVASRIRFRPGDGSYRLYVEWVVAHMVNVCLVADLIRGLAGEPEREYAIRLVLSPGTGRLDFPSLVRGDYETNEIESEPVFPLYSFGSRAELGRLLTEVREDFLDAANVYRTEAVEVMIDEPKWLI